MDYYAGDLYVNSSIVGQTFTNNSGSAQKLTSISYYYVDQEGGQAAGNNTTINLFTVNTSTGVLTPLGNAAGYQEANVAPGNTSTETQFNFDPSTAPTLAAGHTYAFTVTVGNNGTNAGFAVSKQNPQGGTATQQLIVVPNIGTVGSGVTASPSISGSSTYAFETFIGYTDRNGSAPSDSQTAADGFVDGTRTTNPGTAANNYNGTGSEFTYGPSPTVYTGSHVGSGTAQEVFTVIGAPVPEPSSIAILACSISGLLARRRMRVLRHNQ